jgi:DDE superfamily endonuclease
MDETGLFYRMQPRRSLSTKALSGTKVSKERLTLTICTNESGSHKLPCWVIGKSKNPRAFKGIKGRDVAALGVQWYANSKAWMLSEIFLDFVKWFNKEVKKFHGGKKVLISNS